MKKANLYVSYLIFVWAQGLVNLFCLKHGADVSILV